MQTNIHQVNQEEAFNLLSFFIKTNSNVLLQGRRGIGKTDIAQEAILSCKFKTGYINLSAIERPDLAGYPNLFEHSDIITFKSPYYLPPLKKDAKPDLVLLFDEVDKAPREMDNPLLEILSKRTINNKPLNVAACILTGNLLQEGAHSRLLSSAMMDRVAKYELTFEFDKWLKWGIENSIHDLVLGFLKTKPNLTCGDIEYSALATPSPRGWTLAARAIDKAKDLKITDEETIVSIVSGFVGEEAGQEFGLWYGYYRRFEPQALALIDKNVSPSAWNDWNPIEQMVFVITASRVARTKFIEASKTKPKYGCIERLCGFLNGLTPEMQMLGISNSFPLEMVVNPRWKLYQCGVFFELSKKLSGT
jgi:AAA domain (dynein-related subfamily)